MSGSAFVVFSGAYSDRKAHCAFTTGEEADQFAVRANTDAGLDEDDYGAWHVQELPLYETASAPKLVEMWTWATGDDVNVHSFTKWEFDVDLTDERDAEAMDKDRVLARVARNRDHVRELNAGKTAHLAVKPYGTACGITHVPRNEARDGTTYWEDDVTCGKCLREIAKRRADADAYAAARNAGLT